MNEHAHKRPIISKNTITETSRMTLEFRRVLRPNLQPILQPD
jgi:hypothetical protein